MLFFTYAFVFFISGITIQKVVVLLKSEGQSSKKTWNDPFNLKIKNKSTIETHNHRKGVWH